jgi:hypothetical protein
VIPPSVSGKKNDFNRLSDDDEGDEYPFNTTAYNEEDIQFVIDKEL